MRLVPCLILLAALSTPASAEPRGAPAKRPLVARIVKSIRDAAIKVRYFPRHFHSARHPDGIRVSFIPGSDPIDAAPALQRLARAERSSRILATWNGRSVDVDPYDSVQSIADGLAGDRVTFCRAPRSVRGMEMTVFAGDHLSAAARVMARTARREGIIVDGTFSQKPLVAAPGASWKSIADQYRRAP